MALLPPVTRDAIPADIPVEIGTRLQMQTQTGQTMPVTVTALDDAQVELDANHPLAGKDLTFKIEVVEVKAA